MIQQQSGSSRRTWACLSVSRSQHIEWEKEKQTNKLLRSRQCFSHCALNMIITTRKSSATSLSSRNEYSDALSGNYPFRSRGQEKVTPLEQREDLSFRSYVLT